MADGDTIMLLPVVGWEIGTLPEGNVMLLVRYVESIPPLGTSPEAIQAMALSHRYTMAAEQFDELAEGLRHTAEQSRKRRGLSN